MGAKNAPNALLAMSSITAVSKDGSARFHHTPPISGAAPVSGNSLVTRREDDCPSDNDPPDTGATPLIKEFTSFSKPEGFPGFPETRCRTHGCGVLFSLICLLLLSCCLKRKKSTVGYD
jgi:hypothetical protein